MYSTLIFDLSEVLISGLKGVEKILSPRLGLPEHNVIQALFAPHTYEFFRGEVTEQTWLERLLRQNSWDGLSADDVAHIVRHNFDRRVDGMQPVLARLAGRYELALLSDHAREWMDYIRPRHTFLSVFPHRFFSFDLGHTKREKAAFSMALAGLNKTADECLFIDDLASNIAVAASVGIQGIQFESAEQLAAALRGHGITLS
jgi:HAD superfamily hydrolase (TIGR01509 family)